MLTIISKAEAVSLRKRWSELETERVNVLLAEGRFDSLELGFVEDNGRRYHDLRGLRIARMIREQRFVGFDFSLCTVLPGKHGGFGGRAAPWVILDDCRFQGATLHEATFVVTATNCDFSNAKFGDTFGRHFTECSFRGTNLSTVQSVNNRFMRCDFSAANMRNSQWHNGVFDNCVWTGCRFGMGSFDGSRFIGTRPDPTETPDMIMDDVVFEPAEASTA